MRRKNLLFTAAAALAAFATILLPSPDAQAFCGFYVSGADKEMYNNATMVVMMREGTKTVLSMRNNYEGPPEDFAMIIPVPQVLQKENVKTLDDEVFDKVDKLAAPRLVEYWEQDPCAPNQAYGFGGLGMIGTGRGGGGMGKGSGIGDLGVKVEAEFDVDEYNVVILSAKESNGLEKWLKAEKYNVPKGAGPLLKPYIEGGQYFFAAKVDPKKVKFKDGQAQLSPLRFHYDTKEFSLPVRLGLINAKGHQDLLVHILAKGQRYEVSNYKNVTIPTNLIVEPKVKKRFAHFYTTLFDRVIEENPGAVVTEYSWNAMTCDPCPTPALNRSELLELGEDAMGKANDGAGNAIGLGMRGGGGGGSWAASGWVLTRLHARYTAETMKEDLIFQKAEAIVGGRGMPHGTRVIEEGLLGEQRATPAAINNFQGRYIILNQWEKEIKCEEPVRGRWGGPTDGRANKPKAAQDTAFIKNRGLFKLSESIVTKDVPQLKNLDGAGKKEEEAVARGGGEVIEEESEGQATISAGKPTDGNPEARSEQKPASCQVAPAHMPGEVPAGLLLLGALVGLKRRER